MAASNKPEDYRLQKYARIEDAQDPKNVKISAINIDGVRGLPFTFNWDEQAYPNFAIQRVDQRGMLKPAPNSKPAVGYGDIYLSMDLVNEHRLPRAKYPSELAAMLTHIYSPQLLSLVAVGLNASGDISKPVELLSETFADLSRGLWFDVETGRLDVALTKKGALLFPFGFSDEPDPEEEAPGVAAAGDYFQSERPLVRRMALSALEDLAKGAGTSSVATLLRNIIDLTS